MRRPIQTINRFAITESLVVCAFEAAGGGVRPPKSRTVEKYIQSLVVLGEKIQAPAFSLYRSTTYVLLLFTYNTTHIGK